MPKKTNKKTIIWADVHAAFLENPCLSDLVSRFGVPPKELRARAKKEKWYEELQESCKFDTKVIRLNVDRSERRLEGFPKGLYPLWVEPLKRWAKTGETVGIGVTERLAEVISQKVDPKAKAIHEKSVRDALKTLPTAHPSAEFRQKLSDRGISQKDISELGREMKEKGYSEQDVYNVIDKIDTDANIAAIGRAVAAGLKVALEIKAKKESAAAKTGNPPHHFEKHIVTQADLDRLDPSDGFPNSLYPPGTKVGDEIKLPVFENPNLPADYKKRLIDAEKLNGKGGQE